MNASTDRQRTENVVNAISLLKDEGMLHFHSEGSDMRGELDIRVTDEGLNCVIRPTAVQGNVNITRYLRCDSQSANALAREILTGPETGIVAVAGQEGAAAD